MWGVSFWVFPLISGCAWVGMLIAMLVVWCVEGRPHYASMGDTQTVAYISDIGAEGLKPLFIAGCSVMSVFLDLAFLSERWLRHQGRLVRNQTRTEKALTILSIVFALIGTAGVILLSIFDTLRHPRLHDIFLLLFIVGFVVSAIFMCWEYQRLGIHFREHRILRISFWIKLVFIIVEVLLAIAFAVCTFRGAYNAGAILEWVIAFLFTFYVSSYFIDLAPAVRYKNGFFTSGQTELEVESNDHANYCHEPQYEGDGSRPSRHGHGVFGGLRNKYRRSAHGHAVDGTSQGNGVNGTAATSQMPNF